MNDFTEEAPLPNGKLTLRVIPQNADTNISGDISGGWVIRQMDMAAEETARAIAKGRVSMVACDNTSFLSPIKTGMALCCYTKISEIGSSSIYVNVEVWSQMGCDAERHKVCDSTFVYVALDEAGRIRSVPKG